MDSVFGRHDLASPGERAATAPSLAASERGLARIWRMRHGPLRVVAHGMPNRPRTVEFVTNLQRTGCFQLLLVEAGAARIEVSGDLAVLAGGDAFLLTNIDTFVFSTAGAFAGVWIELPIWWVFEICGGVMVGSLRRLDGALATTAVLRAALALLFEPEDDQDLTHDLVEMMGAVLARCLTIAARDERPLEGAIHRIHSYVAANYRTPGLSPRDAAKALGFSLSSLHKSLAAHGWTFGGALAGMRLSVAGYRLTRSAQSISEIAFDCGFTSLSHFCHAFKARYGVTASSVRGRGPGR
jgi:AraC family transcriptional regulator, positive regulator of tynA and feaB